MTQFELFSSPTTPATLAVPTATAPVVPDTNAGPGSVPAEELRRHLQGNMGLWVDPQTAAYMTRAVSRGVADVEFIAADARTGRSAFRTMRGRDLAGAEG